MRIKQIKAFPLRYPEPNDHNNIRHIMLVRVETDDGAVGWGEAITMWPEASRAARTIVEDGLGPVLIGRDPRDTYANWLAMKEQSWWYGEGGIASFAISALDIALWDLKGKALGVPLYQLLGGKVNDRLRACVSTHPAKSTIDAMAQEFAAYVEQGYTAVKVGFGKKGDARLGYEPKRDIAFVFAGSRIRCARSTGRATPSCAPPFRRRSQPARISGQLPITTGSSRPVSPTSFWSTQAAPRGSRDI